jgi:hypothetical protein
MMHNSLLIDYKTPRRLKHNVRLYVSNTPLYWMVACAKKRLQQLDAILRLVHDMCFALLFFAYF